MNYCRRVLLLWGFSERATAAFGACENVWRRPDRTGQWAIMTFEFPHTTSIAIRPARLVNSSIVCSGHGLFTWFFFDSFNQWCGGLMDTARTLRQKKTIKNWFRFNKNLFYHRSGVRGLNRIDVHSIESQSRHKLIAWWHATISARV